MVRDLFDTMMNMVKVSKEEISLANGGNYKKYVCGDMLTVLYH